MSDIDEKLATNLKAIRTRVFGMTRGEFAEALDVHIAQPGRWEKGVTSPSFSKLRRMRGLARAHGLPWDDCWFFDGPPLVRPVRGSHAQGDA